MCKHESHNETFIVPIAIVTYFPCAGKNTRVIVKFMT